ncbi:aminodeoxychorismate synthase component I [Pseudomonas sp. zfem004]|uniref:aminodeoxychorismate synthase component I n=1 Tax=Pseudomonas sp. zfem004 TaxID=3078199 RepID=UPI002928202D|nr:aminodeoxychorismate synthase component I [Pseudomonas sp. zfem004]MDU9403025.1 aminodeoxychorismate synthase component I [Pseudomonas sp. zfem004]
MSDNRVEFRALDHVPDTLAAFEQEFAQSPACFLLESSVVIEGFSRFTFMGDSQGRWAEVLRYQQQSASVEVRRLEGTQHEPAEDFLEWLSARLAAQHTPCPAELPFDFNLGYVGVLGYDLKVANLGDPVWSSPTPDATFLLATRMLVIDHQENRSYLLHLVKDEYDQPTANAWLDHASARLQALPAAQPLTRRPRRMSLEQVEQWIAAHANARHAKADYIEKILEAQRQIVDGETYEVCLTNLVELPFEHSAYALYKIMRELSPAPHAAYYAIPGFEMASSSPERFLKVDRLGQVEAKPIKGTRPRSNDPREDQRQLDDLRQDEKDLAENLMIVDLLRNDLGRVCQIGSVKVPGLFVVESYSHAHQLVSTIQGQLKPGMQALDCVKASFPGGSMTGAPKKRTMQIIGALEQGARGAYSGSLGWLSLSGACDLSILIRSVAVHDALARFGVGGAITALSDPESEYVETVVKASGVVEAIALLDEVSA